MDTSKHAQIGQQPSIGAFASVAVDFPFAIPIVITCPLTSTVADGRVMGVAAVPTPPLFGIQNRATGWHVLFHMP